MENNKIDSRRGFLKQMFTLSVFSAACPHILLGKLTPTNIEDGGGSQISGIYDLDLEMYPQLLELYGSVRIDIPRSDGGAPMRIIFIRIDYSQYKYHFACLYERCPHEGYVVNDIHPVLHIIQCPGHGTMFDETGTYISGPAAQDLDKYQSYWDGKSRYAQVNFPFYEPSEVEEGEGGIEDNLSYIRKNYPNPFTDNTTIEYGIERDANVEIYLTDLLGNKVMTFHNGFLSAGHYTINISGNELIPNMYLMVMRVNNQERANFKIIKQ